MTTPVTTEQQNLCLHFQFMDDLDDRELRGEYDGNIKVINKREVISPSKGYQTLQTMVADAVKNGQSHFCLWNACFQQGTHCCA